MKTLLLYILQVIISSGLLYGYYHFFLRNNHFHQYNRFYLLLVPVISLLIPFFNIPLYFTNTGKDSLAMVLSSFSNSEEIRVDAGAAREQDLLSWQTITYLVYACISFIIIMRILFSIAAIRRIIRSNPATRIGAVNFVTTDAPNTPFSFFRWMFWNKKIELNSSKGEQLFRHELFHIEQKHSYDILYMELLTSIGWINPFFHLIRKELKAIHEFLADQFAIRENERWQYAELLLMQAFQTHQPLVNPFFNTQIKRRIAMITNSSKPSYQYLRKLMVLPVAAIVVFLFAFSYREKNKESIKNDLLLNSQQSLADTTRPGTVKLKSTETVSLKLQEVRPDNAPINLQLSETVPDNPITTLKLAEIVPDTDKIRILDKVETEAKFPGGEGKWKEYLHRNLNPGVATQHNAPNGTYTTVIQFIVDSKGNVSDIIPLTKHGYGMEEEIMRLISKGPKWEPAMQNGKYVTAYRKLVFTFVAGKEDERFSSDKKIFDKVEIEAAFPGGPNGWRDFLQKNINALVPVDKGAPAGSYTVMVQFIVEKDGSVSNIKPLTKHGYGMEEEVIRLMRTSPNWEPALQNGKIVTAYRKQPVTFQITDEGKKKNG